VKIAVIGSGISGLAAAYGLRKQYDVHVFEAGGSAGGHSNTVKVLEGDMEVSVDTGFVVYNETTYPEFTALLEELDVATIRSEMSFGVSCTRHDLEYSSRGIPGMFSQPTAMLRPARLRLLFEISRFNQESKALLDSSSSTQESLGEFLRERGFSFEFREHYITPLVGAIWSTPPAAVTNYPARYLFAFLRNHGLLSFTGRLIWRTIKGGSEQYVEKLAARLPNGVRVNEPVESVSRDAQGVSLAMRGGETERFDRVVLACHSDQALGILTDATISERRALGELAYEPSRVVLHRDARVMPKRKRAWASWNFATDTCPNLPGPASVTYHMNRLQRLDATMEYFVTVNPRVELDQELVIQEFAYAHPQYTRSSIESQKLLSNLNGLNRTHFAGAYMGHGFHEDGFRSGQDVAVALSRTASLPVVMEARS
jgi:predicted NAD/FAD-binding protein